MITKEKKIIKLEAIRYCLNDLIVSRTYKGKTVKALSLMRAHINRLSKEIKS